MISVIIPVLNEEKALPGTLENVLMQVSDPDQIIVVDGGSTDQTETIARHYKHVEFTVSGRGRARQMNAGAAIATAEWLLFLHADTALPPDGLQAIQALSSEADKLAGCFHKRFSKDHWFLRFVSRLHNWRCHRSRIMYGDQAMFIRREFFERIGGFPERAILEDVLISEIIVEETQPVLLEQAVITSSRKFEQRGIYRSFFDIFVIMSCYELKLPIFRRAFFAGFR